MEWISALIDSYLRCARAMSARLAATYGVDDLLKARRSKVIPPAGVTDDGLEFRFHGIGVALDDATWSIDIDFLPFGLIGGFDAWRLHLFTEENPSVTKRSQAEVQVALDALEHRGDIVRVEFSSLYRSAK